MNYESLPDRTLNYLFRELAVDPKDLATTETGEEIFYCESVDLVLPYLEKELDVSFSWWFGSGEQEGWQVSIGIMDGTTKEVTTSDKRLARAMVIALLKAKEIT